MGFVPRFQDNKVNIDYSRCTPISVIATFATDGRYKPLYFLVKDEYSNECKVQVKGIKYTKDERDSTTFCCVYQVGSVQRECLLTFYIQQHLWVLEN